MLPLYLALFFFHTSFLLNLHGGGIVGLQNLALVSLSAKILGFQPPPLGVLFKEKSKKQAGAELCQAQVKLGQPKLTEFVFHLINN